MIILDPDEKLRIAKELGITPITLDRWVKGEHAPSCLKKLNKLHASIPPNLREQFGELIAAEYAEFSADRAGRGSTPDPAGFLACSY